jgi:hypothetical protein
MEGLKTKSLKRIEQRMEGLDDDSLRYRVLESAKNFKASWINLGQALYSVWKDKLYKKWEYGSFEAYTSKEIGVRKQTAMKLLRSYCFLEKEEPALLKGDYMDSADAAGVPTYESIDVLRLAKGKKMLDDQDYINLKKEVFEKGKDPRAVRRDLTAIIRQRQELDPEEAAQQRRFVTVRRLLSALKSLKREVEILKLLASSDVGQITSLINKLEEEIS